MSAKTQRARVSRTFLFGPDKGIVIRGNSVIQGMRGDKGFPNPPSDLAELQQMLDAYDALITQALDGSKTVMAQRNSQRSLVVHALRGLAAYVDTVSNGDATIILASGFEAWTYNRTPPQFPDTPSILDVKYGNSGEFYITISVFKKAKSCELRFGPNGAQGIPDSWTTVPVTRVRPPTLITGLTPGQIYQFQVRAVGHLGVTNWSDSVSKMAN